MSRFKVGDIFESRASVEEEHWNFYLKGVITEIYLDPFYKNMIRHKFVPFIDEGFDWSPDNTGFTESSEVYSEADILYRFDKELKELLNG